ncbi:MAG: HDIG domain-containing protein [Syntrophobacteraceae bacterium]|nr:HDIG domain-containing protein [Syntrophobacteraceae bacterium]
MKPILITVYIAVCLFACYAQNINLGFFHLKPGERAPITFRADRPFAFDQAKAFGGKRNLALSQYVPLYMYSPGEADSGRKKMADFIAALAVSGSGGRMDGAVLASYVRKYFGVDLTPDQADLLAQFPGLKNLLEGMLAIENSILEMKIVKEPGHLKGKATAEVRYPEPMGTVAYPCGRFLTVKQARERLWRQAEKIFWQVDSKVLAPVVALASATLAPNLIYDQKENERRIEETIQRYPSSVIHFDSGQVLAPARKTITEEDELLIAASRKAVQTDFLASVSWVALAVIILTLLYSEALSKMTGMPSGSGRAHSIHFSVLIVSVLIFEAFLLLTSWPVNFLPIAFVPLVLVLLGQSFLPAASTTLMAATVAALISGRNIESLIYFLIASVTALLFSGKIGKRSQLLVPSAATGAVCALMAMSFGVYWQGLRQAIPATLDPGALLVGISNLSFIRDAGWAAAGGLIAAPLAVGLLPVFEFALGVSSIFRIDAWTNLEHPILKELLNRAPGTYQHTMSVAGLAQVAADAIGANVPLLRAGVYFHDIGKMSDPGYFTENQAGGPNPHDELEAEHSARIIIDHVNKGLLIGKKARVPQNILDFVSQHHGTLVLECFWDKAKHRGPNTCAQDKDFRYPGPKPQSKEAAILMIVDAVEAASRTVPDHGRAAVEALVRHIMEKRIDDGQFDQCDITTEELARVRGALIDAVSAAFHSRVVYPWQEEAGSDHLPAEGKN